jgi:hypothetical protein
LFSASSLHLQKREHRQAPHHVGARVLALGNQAGGDDAGGIAHPDDLDARHRAFGGGLEGASCSFSSAV